MPDQADLILAFIEINNSIRASHIAFKDRVT